MTPLKVLKVLTFFMAVAFSGIACGSEICLVVKSETGMAISGAHVISASQNNAIVTDANGHFCVDTDSLSGRLTITYLGYSPLHLEVSILKTLSEVRMTPALTNLPAFEINADRTSLFHPGSLVKVEMISPVIFERSRSVNLAEGLGFSPALRVENNCQSCGFTQVRMNGLPGNYSQIVLNGRPVFSALTGVYGLEFIPVGSIERVEVLRGGGSALYGGNAIAGVVNVVTKSPEENAVEAGMQYTATGQTSPDRIYHVGTSRVSDEGDMGVRLDYSIRNREAFDANTDGFSEITRLDQNVLTSQAFIKTSDKNRLGFDLLIVDEKRRGGDNIHRPPHEAQLAEELAHKLASLGLTYEWYGKSLLNKSTIYASTQYTARDSYYGAGGRTLTPGDTINEDLNLALNAYGQTTDRVLLAGYQHARQLSTDFDINGGFEIRHNAIVDEMSGYGRSIDQEILAAALYTQATWKISRKLSLGAGGRYEYSLLRGDYRFPDDLGFSSSREFNNLVGRFIAEYSFSDKLSAKASYAGGFRLPQAFDEDLHIEAVGGAARVVVFDESLEPEKSRSYLATVVYEAVESWQLILSGFYTRLENPFITAVPWESESGISLITKRNGDGAFVAGFTLEGSWNPSNTFGISGNFTQQIAQYDNPEIVWTPDNEHTDQTVFTQNLLRTPRSYGSITAEKKVRRWTGSVSGIYTGSMEIPRLINTETEQTTLVETPVFFDAGVKLSNEVRLKKESSLTFFVGCYNLFNSYQNDFETGPERDSGYVYGPMRPRSVYGGIQFNW